MIIQFIVYLLFIFNFFSKTVLRVTCHYIQNPQNTMHCRVNHFVMIYWKSNSLRSTCSTNQEFLYFWLALFFIIFFYLQITDFKLSIDVAIDNEQQMTIFKRIIHLYTCISDKACKGSDILNDDKVRHFHFEYYNSILYILREIRRCFI